jgi:TonB family protein
MRLSSFSTLLFFVIMTANLLGQGTAQNEAESDSAGMISDTNSIVCIYPEFELPTFPGGDSVMRSFIHKNLSYPKGGCFVGRVYVQVSVDTTGKLKDVVVRKGLKDCPSCDSAAMQVVRSMPLWIPGRMNGKVCEMKVVIPIYFEGH